MLEALDVVGVLCVEFFLTRDGRLLINELAPRPHNSGHLTFDAASPANSSSSCGRSAGCRLGSTELLRPAAMANLLGDLWPTASPTGRPPAGTARQAASVRQTPGAPGRKMGHLTALANTVEEARELALRARADLTRAAR